MKWLRSKICVLVVRENVLSICPDMMEKILERCWYYQHRANTTNFVALELILLAAAVQF